jgi:hypothetical protein
MPPPFRADHRISFLLRWRSLHPDRASAAGRRIRRAAAGAPGVFHNESLAAKVKWSVISIARVSAFLGWPFVCSREWHARPRRSRSAPIAMQPFFLPPIGGRLDNGGVAGANRADRLLRSQRSAPSPAGIDVRSIRL